MKQTNRIILDPSQFSIESWQRKNINEINTLYVQIQATQQDPDKCFKHIQNMKLFLDHFQMPIQHISIFFFYPCKKNEISEQLLQMIFKDIYPKYKDTITELTLINLHHIQFGKTVKKSDCQQFVESLMLPLKKLSMVRLENYYQQFEMRNEFMLSEMVHLIGTNDQFKTIQSLHVFQENNENGNESLNTKRNLMMNHQSKLIQQISEMVHLKTLQISLENMSFNPDFYQKAYKNIANMTNLEQVGLNLWSNKCSLKQQISYLKYLTQFGKTLNELTFISDNNSKANDAKSLKEALLSFENLEEFSLVGVNFTSKAQLEDFLKYFQEYNKIKRCTLHIGDAEWKNIDIASLLFNSINNLEQLQKLVIIFPAQQKFDAPQQIELTRFIKSKSQSLTHIDFEMNLIENCTDSTNLFREIVQIKNLAYLKISLEPQLDYILDASQDGVENIRSLKKFLFYFTHNNPFIVKLSWATFLEQSNLKSIKFQSYEYDKVRVTCTDEALLTYMSKFQLEKLSFNLSFNPFINAPLQIKITNMNKNSLKVLKGYLHEEIETLPNLQYLKIPYPKLQSQVPDSQQIGKLPSLIILRHSANRRFLWDFYNFNFEFDVQRNYYLTTIDFPQIKLIHQWQQEYLFKRQAILSHLVIYSQLIKPFLNYQVNYIHWDLSIDY